MAVGRRYGSMLPPRKLKSEQAEAVVSEVVKGLPAVG
jgi:hypothetical protein